MVWVPVDERGPLPCPEGCGVRIVQWTNPLKGDLPELKAVVEPVYRRRTEP